MEEGSDGGRKGGTDCYRLRSRWVIFQALTLFHGSNRRNVPVANVGIEHRRTPEHCACNTNQHTQKCKKTESEHGGDYNGGDDRFQGRGRRCGGKKYGKRKKRWKKGRWGKGASKGTLSIAEVVLTMEG